MKPRYCCNTKGLTEYYTRQAGGGGLPVFVGSRYQRGGGLGSILGNIGKRVLPFLMKGVKALGKEALRTGVNVASDALEGKNISESIRERAAESRDILKSKAARKLREFGDQVGSGRKRRREGN